MSPEPADDLITITEIAEIAGAARPTVSNWKRRHRDDFPPKRAQGDRGPLFRRDEVLHWLITNGKIDATPAAPATADPTSSLTASLDALRDRVPTEVAVEAGLSLLAGDDLPSAVPQELRDRVGTLGAGVADMDATDRRRAANELIDNALVSSSRGLSELATPPAVRQLMVGLLGDRGAVYDPASGLGSLLAESTTSAASPALFGQEINTTAAHISRLYLHAIGADADIRVGNTLTDDHFAGQHFDGILASPPFGTRPAETDLSPADPRWLYELPGRSGDMAWLQHTLHHLAPGGRAVVLVPASFLFQSGAVGRLRASLLRAGHIRVVIQLPPWALTYTGVITAVLVLAKSPAAAPPTVLVGAPALTVPGDRHHRLDPERVDEVTRLVRAWLDGTPVELPPEWAQVDLEQLAAAKFTLDPRHLVSPTTVTARPLPETRADLDTAIAQALHSADALTNQLPALLALLPSDPTTAPRVPLKSLPGVTIQRGIKHTDLVKEGQYGVHTPTSLLNDREPSRFLPEDHALLTAPGPHYNARRGDLLVALEGMTGAVGRVVVVEDDMFVSAGFAIIRVEDPDHRGPGHANGPSPTTSFLAQWLQGPEARAGIQRLTTGTTLERVALRDLARLPVPDPPRDTQEGIGAAHETLRSARQLVTALTQSIDTIDTLTAETVTAALAEEDE